MEICNIIGEKYQDNLIWSRAYSYYVRANNLTNAINALKEVMKSGYNGEQDLFVTRLAFEVLVRNYKKSVDDI
jgi:nitrogen regulatory protein PII